MVSAEGDPHLKPASVLNASGAADPVRLRLLHVLFTAAASERSRRGQDDRSPAGPTSLRQPSTVAEKPPRLTGALRAHLAAADDAELDREHLRLARAFLREIDRQMAGSGSPPGKRVDVGRLAGRWTAPARDDDSPRVGLVSLPWMAPTMPSIQLATLRSALSAARIESDVHELYVDYSAQIGLNLYSLLDNLLGYLPEWIFSRHYYGPEHGDDLAEMIEQNPLNGFQWPELADDVLAALEPVTRQYLDDVISGIDWSRYDIVGCSLTVSQLGASMAFARRLKLAHPSVRIIFGGSQCAGPMGQAILRACPYVDVAVHIEGELVLPELVRRLRSGGSLAGLAGVSYRDPTGEVVGDSSTELVRGGSHKLPLDYDPYFHRLARLGLLEKVNPWLPFESSRGCWYGQKVQCTFCGLHEIMEFRAWEADPVLAELERFEQRYGINRFYCMDLIMPREYLRTLLPQVVERRHDWTFFYEIKANMRRHELEVLADSGVRWVQPGIESLDTDLLQLMRKGVKPHQNLLLLKWCQELGIYCGWNLLHGLPGEKESSYTRMVELIPKLRHLQPPAGGGAFQLHRFSPYFERPAEHGIRWTGAHPMYRFAFPIPKAELDQLVYLHEFTLDPSVGAPIDTTELEAAVAAWRQANRGGASLMLTPAPDGSSVVVDHREIAEPPVRHHLSPAETELYRYLDAGVGQRRLADEFQARHRAAFRTLGGESGLAEVVSQWLAHDLVVAIDGKLVSLALFSDRMRSETVRSATGDGDPAQRPQRVSKPPARSPASPGEEAYHSKGVSHVQRA